MEITFAQRRCFSYDLIWFGFKARISEWGGEGHIFLLQMKTTCLCGVEEGEGEVSTLWAEWKLVVLPVNSQKSK
jgi:hypothetical protein